jgi:hypothetical protein
LDKLAGRLVKSLRRVRKALKAAHRLAKESADLVVLERGSKDYLLTAYHEAGHAVFGVVLGMGTGALEIGKSSPGSRGRTWFGDGYDGAAAEAKVAMALAGCAAEHWHGMTFTPEASKQDRRLARIDLPVRASKSDLMFIARNLAKVLELPRVGDAVTRVANLLDGAAGGRVEGREVEAAVKSALVDAAKVEHEARSAAGPEKSKADLDSDIKAALGRAWETATYPARTAALGVVKNFIDLKKENPHV